MKKKPPVTTEGFLNLAEAVRFELTEGYKPSSVFKTGALNRSATLPCAPSYGAFVFMTSKTYRQSNQLHIVSSKAYNFEAISAPSRIARFASSSAANLAPPIM